MCIYLPVCAGDVKKTANLSSVAVQCGGWRKFRASFYLMACPVERERERLLIDMRL